MATLDDVVAAAGDRCPPGFVLSYYAQVGADDVAGRNGSVFADLAIEHWELGRVRAIGETRIDVVALPASTVVRIVTDDMPFLVDSLSIELTRRGLAIHLAIHPIFVVQRDAAGVATAVSLADPAGPSTHREAWMTLLVDRVGGKVDELAADLRDVVEDVKVVVADWAAMRECTASLADPLAAVDTEAAAFLRWLTHDRFTFLTVVNSHDVRLGTARTGQSPPMLPAGVLVLGRGHEPARVHHARRLDVVQVDIDGVTTTIGGLYTGAGRRQDVVEIPVVRRKVEQILKTAGFPEASHSYKALLAVLEDYPREELLVAPAEEIGRVAHAVLSLAERRQVKAFVRYDAQANLFSVQVYLPRDHYTTGTVWRIEQHLQALVGAASADTSSLLTDSLLARIHVVLPVDSAVAIEEARLDRELTTLTRTWAEDLREALGEASEPERADDTETRWIGGLTAAYRSTYSAAAAVDDIGAAESLDEQGFTSRIVRGPDGWRLKLYRRAEAVALSSVLPVLENFGVRVIDQRPFALTPADGAPVWLADFGLEIPGDPFTSPDGRERFRSALHMVLEGDVENDSFNGLVLACGITAEQVTVLRAYAKYLRQAGTAFSETYIAQTLAANGSITALLLELFTTRLDPTGPGEGQDLIAKIVEGLATVASLDHDRILTSFLRLVQATLRTTFFQRDERGKPRPFVAFKLDPSAIPDLPLPRPMFEIWVYSPRVEAVHLRGGRVARGGIRWSDRREDFRTEVLGLMKAQMVKNAVIVPTGAKGGFVVKQPPLDAELLRAEVVDCYRLFITGLLSLTDNIVGGDVVAPPDTVRLDDDDPYLVVAADKGTATFSDIANGISLAHGFWLGDAFASGGSEGYDHKVMAITARGAWESVRRHFRSLGIDADRAQLTVVGVGDMSGDVFGNGMLRSPHLKLLAAFDHRHVFIDPDPDPASSFAARERLFVLPRSSWAEYDASAISNGGGVFPRSAKSIALSAPARRALGIDVEHLTPAEVIRAILRAPVDLLWNGGIGTYVKAASESNADVGDRANDAVRLNGADLRCKVVAEGGNLGFTQRGRIEYALTGGLINTDAIDNSAGVDCSDHEVNLKIVLDALVHSGVLGAPERHDLLREMTDDVAELVLEDNRAQTLALANARHQAAPMIDVHGRYIRALTAEHLIDRDLECLPTDRQLAERQAAGLGLTAPELSVLLAYTKMTNTAEVLASRLPDDAALEGELFAYFPAAVVGRFADTVRGHRLRREIIATRVVNLMVNRAGISFDHRMAEESGASVADITAAHVVSARIFELDRWWHEIDGLAVSSSVQTPLLIELRHVVERGVQWLLRRRRPPIEIAATVEAFSSGAAELASRVPELLIGADHDQLFASAARFVTSGVPDELALRAAAWPLLHLSLDLIEVAAARRVPVVRAAAVAFSLSDRLGLDWLRDRIDLLPQLDRWQSMSRTALRDDFTTEWRGLTADVLRGDPLAEAADVVDAWVVVNERAVTRCRQVFADVRAGGSFDLATLSVCIRAVRNLTMAGVAGV